MYFNSSIALEVAVFVLLFRAIVALGALIKSSFMCKKWCRAEVCGSVQFGVRRL